MSTKESYYRRYTEKRAKRDKERSEAWKYKLGDPLIQFTGILALGTIALAVVAALQWCTLEKTDRTLKDTLAANIASQRAAVYFNEIEWKAEPVGNSPRFVGYPKWQNNGSTGTVGLKYAISCGLKMSDLDFRKHGTVGRVLGAHQPGDGGACIIEPGIFPNGLPDPGQFATAWVGGKASYYDVYDPKKQRITEFCMQVPISVVKIISRDGPNSAGTVSIGEGHNILCSEHNCSDNDCPEEDRIK